MAVKLFKYECDIVIIDNNSPNMEIMCHYISLLEGANKVFIEPDMKDFLTEACAVYGTQKRFKTAHGQFIRLKPDKMTYKTRINPQTNRMVSDSSIMMKPLRFFVKAFEEIEGLGQSIPFLLWKRDFFPILEREMQLILSRVCRVPETDIKLPLLIRNIPDQQDERGILLDYIAKGVTNPTAVPDYIQSLLENIQEARLSTKEQLKLVMPSVNFILAQTF